MRARFTRADTGPHRQCGGRHSAFRTRDGQRSRATCHQVFHWTPSSNASSVVPVSSPPSSPSAPLRTPGRLWLWTPDLPSMLSSRHAWTVRGEHLGAYRAFPAHLAIPAPTTGYHLPSFPCGFSATFHPTYCTASLPPFLWSVLTFIAVLQKQGLGSVGLS